MTTELFSKADHVELYNQLIPFKEYFEDKGYTFLRTDALKFVSRTTNQTSIDAYRKVILLMSSELSYNLGIASNDEHTLSALSEVFDELYNERCL